MNITSIESSTLQLKVRGNWIHVDLRRFGRGRAQFRGDYPIRPPSPRTLSPKSRRIDFNQKIQGIISDEEDEAAIHVLGQEMPLIQNVESKQFKNSHMQDQQQQKVKAIAQNISYNIRTNTNSKKKMKKSSKKSSSNYPSMDFQPGNRLVDTNSGQIGQKKRSSGHLYVHKCPQVRHGVGRRQI